MLHDDPNDAAFRQGEPPFRPGDGLEAPSAGKPRSTGAAALVKAIVVLSLQVAAVLIAGWAGLGAYFAAWFRFDSVDEFEMVKQFDVQVGGALALAVVLFLVPSRIKKPVHCAVILAVAALVWLFVSWNLIAHHEWVDRVRSGP